MNKKQLTEKRRRKINDKEIVEISPGREYLTMLLKSNLDELKKITTYAISIRTNIKIIKELIEEVK